MSLELQSQLRAERTPNPDSIKWVVSPPLLGVRGAVDFGAAPGRDVSPLAEDLFAVSGVVGVLLAPSFVTITKAPDRAWPDLAQPLLETLRAFLSSGASALGPAYAEPDPADASPVEAKIRDILDHEIRPLVARDGGDVLFAGFRDGIVELYLQGSCSGCPSSTATLKLGIESRLKELLPQVREVVAL